MGVLPTTNLGINAINDEVVTLSTAMSGIGPIAAPYLPAIKPPYQMSSYRGWQLPPAFISMTQNDGGIWDGCTYWDVFCGIDGAGNYVADTGQNADPDFGYIGFWWSQNGYTDNSERGTNNGTSLTFGGGYCNQYVHGRYYVTITNIMIPNNTGFCTNVHLSIWVNGTRVACCNPNPYDYTYCQYTLACEPGGDYKVQCNVNYGTC